MEKKINTVTATKQQKVPVNLAGIFADTFIVFFGTWTLVHQICYFNDFTFYQDWLAAYTFSGFCAAIFIANIIKNKSIEWGEAALWWAILISILLTLTLYRPDSDDEHYLGQAIVALDFTFENMKSLPGFKSGYAITSYDFIRSSISFFTGIPIIYAFYTVGPAIIAALVVIFQWRIFKLISIQNITVAFLIFFVIMLGWGDVHRSPANLGYVKLFQGKGALVWVAIPAMLFYWLEYEKTHNKKLLILLFFSSITAVGFSPTGIPIAVLMMTLFFFSGLLLPSEKKRAGIRIIFLAAILLCFLFLGFLITHYFNYRSSGIHSSVDVRELHTFSDYLVNWEMLHFVLGDTARFWIALLALIICPFVLPKSSTNNLVRIYLGLCATLIAIPFSSAVMAQFTAASFSWRWLFICPFVLCMIAVVDFIQNLSSNNLYKKGVNTAFIAIFLLSGPLVISNKNHTQIKFLFHQLPDEERIILRRSPYYNQPTKLDGSRIISLKDGKPL